MWVQVYSLLITYIGTVFGLFFDLLIGHLWIFIPFIVSFVCATVSLFLRLFVAVNNSA